jgi:ABC-2 family transporter protein
MKRVRMLLAMVRADFLERVRRYNFLLCMGLAVYLGYAVYAGQVTLRLDEYSGVQNSAWTGAVIGLVATVWLSLVGFYVVKNSIQRDRETRVGEILATTPMSKLFYTLSKALSNFAVLAAMVLILAAAALLIQLTQGHGAHVDFVALLGPVLVFGLSGVAVSAAMALLFETLPVLRGGVGNIAYFFLWVFLISMSAATLGHQGIRQSYGGSVAIYNPLPYMKDLSGIATVAGQMQEQLHRLDPAYRGGAAFSAGEFMHPTKKFLWAGVEWNAGMILSRGLWLGIAVVLAGLAAIFFDRFDPARAWLKPMKLKASKMMKSEAEPMEAMASVSSMRLTPLKRDGMKSRFVAMVMAEFRLMMRGNGWWWYLVATGLWIGCLASPLEVARSGVILVAWIWPTLLWSQMGTREAQFATGPLIFSAPRSFPRQMLATWAAGVLVAMVTGSGLGLHEVFARDWGGLAAWIAATVFIPGMALAMGTLTENRKPFEALYTAWWYIGPLHHIRELDFMGTTAGSSTAVAYLVAGVALVTVACGWRRVRLSYA